MFVTVKRTALLLPSSTSVVLMDTGQTVQITQAQRERLTHVGSAGRATLVSSDVALLEKGVLLLERENSLFESALRSAVSSFLENVGALAVMPTEKCNFRCTYCYETFEKGRMSRELVSAVKQFLSAEIERLSSYNLGWFGGEPLLAIDILEDVSAHFRAELDRAGKNGTIGVTTNGSLLNAANRKVLAKIGLDVAHVSVDGPRDIHNAQRRSLTRRNSYDDILANIEGLLVDTTAQILLRVNVDTKSPDACDRVSEWLRQELVPRFSHFSERVQVHAVSIWDATPKSVDGICIEDLSRFQSWWTLRKTVAAASNGTIDDAVASDVGGLGRLACYAGRPNHFVVGADGTVYKCTVAFDLPENQIGTLSQSGFQISPSLERVWTAQNVLTDPTCGACSFGASCLGLHCPLTRLQTGKQPCPSYKRHLPLI